MPAGTAEPPAGRGTVSARVLRRVAAAHVGAGTAGSIDVFLLLLLVLPRPEYPPHEEARLLVLNAVTFAVALPVSLVVGTLWGYRMARPMQRFDEEGRPPTYEERLATVRHPLRSAGIDAVLWLIGALVFAAVNLTVSGDAALHVGVTVAMGGATTTAVTYLLTERTMRPMTARALADGPLPQPFGLGVRGRLLLAWLLATGVPLLGILFVGLHVLERPESTERLAVSVVVLALAAVAVGLHATILVARSLSEPLEGVRRAVARIGAGDLDAEVRVDDASEVGLLQSGFNQMAAGLREREHLRDLFGRHVGEEVARRAATTPIALGGEQRRIAALFVDIVGSTTLVDTRSPEEVVGLLNRFFDVVVDTVTAHGGWVNKFEGDGALCVFGAPVADEGCEVAAVRAARALCERLERELPEVTAGIGVSAGMAVAGNVGTERRYEYTVIGEPVNEAARLCELAKQRPEQRVLVSETLLSGLEQDERARWRLDGEVQLRGRTKPTRLAMPS